MAIKRIKIKMGPSPTARKSKGPFRVKDLSTIGHGDGQRLIYIFVTYHSSFHCVIEEEKEEEKEEEEEEEKGCRRRRRTHCTFKVSLGHAHSLWDHHWLCPAFGSKIWALLDTSLPEINRVLLPNPLTPLLCTRLGMWRCYLYQGSWRCTTDGGERPGSSLPYKKIWGRNLGNEGAGESIQPERAEQTKALMQNQ